MSDDSTFSPEPTPAAEKPAKPVKKNVRRVSHKTASEAPYVAAPAEVVSYEQPASVAESSTSDWPEPESSGDGRPQDGSKRNKRRRRKGKGGQSSAGEPTAVDEPASENIPSTPTPRPAAPVTRSKADPELLAKYAWKIFLAEVSEEGVALIADNDARELSRRCFRLAEIFLDEQARRK